jgi:hypothetical protein
MCEGFLLIKVGNDYWLCDWYIDLSQKQLDYFKSLSTGTNW